MTTPLSGVSIDDAELSDGAALDSTLPEPMDEDEVQAEVARVFERARSFTDTELSERRKDAADYYKGLPFGNEKPGRSTVVSTDLRDTVQAILPDLIRVFTGSDRVVAFRPTSAEKAAEAKQATDYVNHIFMVDNCGFRILHSALKDALVKSMGVTKWWWEDEEVVENYDLTGITPEEVAQLQQDPQLEVEPTGQRMDGTLDVHVIRTSTDGKVMVSALEPEDFLFSENARDIDDALLVAHRTELRRGELVAMGISEEFLDEHGGVSTDAETNPEKIARAPLEESLDDDEGIDAQQKIMYVENYIYMDVDGDGIAEHRRIITIGTGMAVWEDIPWPGRPFADFVPDPEPHTILGLGMFDYTNDIQRIKSGVLRASLDSLAFAVNPRTWAVENQANMQDINNTEIGATIRLRAPGMAGEFIHSYVGKEAFPMLAYMDEQKENRTGTSKAAAGLDPDALQSSTKAAVAATVSGSRAHKELMARIFAENGMTRMFTGILKLVIANQQKPRMVQLSGENFVEIDPRPWDSTMGVTVEVALGTDEERMAVLMATAEKQEQIIQQFGPQNPMTTVAQYRNTLARMTALGGFQPELFWQKVPPDWQPPPPPPPPPTSEEAFIQVEEMKAQVDLMTEHMKSQTSLMETLLREDRERDRIEVDAFIRLADINSKSDKDFDGSMIKVIMESSRREIEGARLNLQSQTQDLQQKIQTLQQQAAAAKPPAPGPAPQ